MGRKSTSQFNPVKKDGSEKWIKEKVEPLPPIEETFDKAKQSFIITLETSIVLAKRVDNLMNIRDYAYKFWGDKIADAYISKVSYFKSLQQVSIDTYEELLKATKEFSLEEFTKDEVKDYYEHIIPSVDSIENEEDLCIAGLIFLTVKPFGEKMAALHRTMLDEKAQRDFMENSND